MCVGVQKLGNQVQRTLSKISKFGNGNWKVRWRVVKKLEGGKFEVNQKVKILWGEGEEDERRNWEEGAEFAGETGKGLTEGLQCGFVKI